MSYKLEWVASPNFTPASQAKAIYGRPRTLEFGAGHWWGDPNAGYSHQGVINTFLNPARQASAHAVVSAGRVTEMVRQADISWATNNANPYTFSIELKPNMTADDKYTCAEYIADKGFHNLQWFPHKHWKATQCNPLPWNEIMDLAKAIWKEKNAPTPVVPEWKRNLRAINPVTLFAIDDNTPLRSLATPAQVIKNFATGTSFEIIAETSVGGNVYYLTRYAYEHGTGQGFDVYELKAAEPPAPVIPEWQKNMVRIDPVKFMVLVPETPIVNLNTAETVKNLARGTWVDFLARTVIGNQEYFISSYSVENAIPNGIKSSDVGVPYVPPAEKPEWLANWRDIEDVKMWTRLEAPLVNLIDGSTIKMLPINTEIDIASATVWHGQDYLITKYSTDAGQPAGISVADLDMKPVEYPGETEEPAPDQPEIRDQINLIVSILKAIAKFFGINI